MTATSSSDAQALADTIDAPQPDERAATPAEVPSRIGRFVIVTRVGEGGMGQVFSAYDPDLDRKVAIKLVRDLGSESPHTVARVKQEAQALARVSHPNVVQIYEAGEASGRVFIAMEYVEGRSLADWQRWHDRAAAGGVAVRLRLYLQAAAGLLAAHRCGLVHRDFKPDNVLVGTDGRVRVADFGLARLLAGLGDEDAPVRLSYEGAPDDTVEPRTGDSGHRLTQAGAILGTPGYMSPEQVRGAEADERSDQFSFCAALYESLYGQAPYPGAGFLDYAGHVLTGSVRPPPPSEVPLVVQRAILRGLALEPADRFASMEALIAALESGLAPESEPLITRADRFRLGLGMAVAAALVATTNGAVAALTHSQNSLLRGVAVIGVFACATGALTLRPPWPVRHRDRYRRMMAFFLVVLATFFFGRLAALLLGLPGNDYYVLEVVALAGLAAVESLRVGWRHGMLALAALAYAPLVHLLPGLRLPLYNGLLTVLTIASVLLHVRQAEAGERGA